jgi:hypothetical protein
LGKQAGFIKINDIDSDLIGFKQKLQALYASLLNHYAVNPNFESFKRRLYELGLKEEEAYLFTRCHDVFDRVLIPLMQFLGDDLVKTHFATLATNEEKANYYNHIKAYSYSVVAQTNAAMPLCSFYQRIIHDIRVAFQN